MSLKLRLVIALWVFPYPALAGFQVCEWFSAGPFAVAVVIPIAILWTILLDFAVLSRIEIKRERKAKP